MLEMLPFVCIGVVIYACIGAFVVLVTVGEMEMDGTGFKATPRFKTGLAILWPVVVVIVLALSVRDVWRWARSLKNDKEGNKE